MPDTAVSGSHHHAAERRLFFFGARTCMGDVLCIINLLDRRKRIVYNGIDESEWFLSGRYCSEYFFGITAANEHTVCIA